MFVRIAKYVEEIPVQKLTLGMHLQAFCGAWLDHPFWRTKFVLTDPNDLELILGSSIKEVWIDVSKGLDADPGESAASSGRIREMGGTLSRSAPQHVR